MSSRTALHSDDSHHEPHEHVVLLYESEQALARSVVAFLTPALLLDEALLVVATPPHRALFAAALTGVGADLPALRAAGRYVELDAEATLEAFLADGKVSRLGFSTTVGRRVRQLATDHGGVHIYGEMVACLWGRGDAAAAVVLEDLWNDLAEHEDFRLCCAYRSDLLVGEDLHVGDMLETHSETIWLEA